MSEAGLVSSSKVGLSTGNLIAIAIAVTAIIATILSICIFCMLTYLLTKNRKDVKTNKVIDGNIKEILNLSSEVAAKMPTQSNELSALKLTVQNMLKSWDDLSAKNTNVRARIVPLLVKTQKINNSLIKLQELMVDPARNKGEIETIIAGMKSIQDNISKEIGDHAIKDQNGDIDKRVLLSAKRAFVQNPFENTNQSVGVKIKEILNTKNSAKDVFQRMNVGKGIYEDKDHAIDCRNNLKPVMDSIILAATIKMGLQATVLKKLLDIHKDNKSDNIPIPSFMKGLYGINRNVINKDVARELITHLIETRGVVLNTLSVKSNISVVSTTNKSKDSFALKFWGAKEGMKSYHLLCLFQNMTSINDKQDKLFMMDTDMFGSDYGACSNFVAYKNTNLAGDLLNETKIFAEKRVCTHTITKNNYMDNMCSVADIDADSSLREFKKNEKFGFDEGCNLGESHFILPEKASKFMIADNGQSSNINALRKVLPTRKGVAGEMLLNLTQDKCANMFIKIMNDIKILEGLYKGRPADNLSDINHSQCLLTLAKKSDLSIRDYNMENEESKLAQLDKHMTTTLWTEVVTKSADKKSVFPVPKGDITNISIVDAVAHRNGALHKLDDNFVDRYTQEIDTVFSDAIKDASNVLSAI